MVPLHFPEAGVNTYAPPDWNVKRVPQESDRNLVYLASPDFLPNGAFITGMQIKVIRDFGENYPLTPLEYTKRVYEQSGVFTPEEPILIDESHEPFLIAKRNFRLEGDLFVDIESPSGVTEMFRIGPTQYFCMAAVNKKTNTVFDVLAATQISEDGINRAIGRTVLESVVLDDKI